MKISFIGGGNMASSLIGGLIADGYNPHDISVVDINEQQLDNLKSRFGIKVFSDGKSAVLGADTVVFSIKPQAFKSVALALAEHIAASKALVISVAAGIRTRDIGRWLGHDCAIVRAMPNTPALVQCSASALFANEFVDSDQKDAAESILRATGLALWVDEESLMDTVTALSGSGPAYFFRVMESLVKAGQSLGLSHEQARLLTLQTALGAAKLAMESKENISELREGVTSPGGTTEQGLKIMEDNNIDELVNDVVNAARQRSIELADMLGED